MRAFATSVCVLLVGTAGCAPVDRSPDTATSVNARRVWSGVGPNFSTGDISPDGRYLSDINWDSGDFRLVDLETGEAKDVTDQGYDAGRYAWTSAFSSDGRRVAVSWYLYETGRHELRVMNLDGTDSRALVPSSEAFGSVEPLDWSPSDEEILVAFLRADLRWQLSLVSMDDGSVRILKTLSWQAPGGEQSYPNAYLSPDGRQVAYDYRPDLGAFDRDIYALAVEGSRETKLTSGPATDRVLGWILDGGGILFYSDRTGTPGIWRLPVRDGAPAGEPELIRPDVQGLVPLGFARNGYAYGVAVKSHRVHTAVVDAEAGTVVVPPQPVDDRHVRESLAADWSPDGGRLAYFTHDPFPDAVESLVIRSVGGQVISAMPLSPVLHTSNGSLRWVTGETILTYAVERGRDGICRVDPQDGSFSRLPDPTINGGGNIKRFEVGLEGHTLYLVRPSAKEEDTSDLLARSVDTGEQRVIGTARGLNTPSLAVSPNGRELAFVTRDAEEGTFALQVMSTSGGGETRTIYHTPRGRSISPPVAWTPDGSRLLFGLETAGSGRGLWSIAVDSTEEPVQVGSEDFGDEIRVHPDGRRIAFVPRDDRGEIRMLSGF